VSLVVFLILLVAAALHAGWNALVRRDGNRDAAATSVAAGGAVIGVVLVPFLPGIASAAVPYALASSAIHVAYYALVARAYRQGELSVVYPIMRGLAPLLVTAVSVAFVERPGGVVVLGVTVLAMGIATLGLDGLRNGRHGLGAALGNAMVIAAYTLVDGLGARASGMPATYAAWLEIGGGIATVGWVFLRRGMPAITPVLERAGLGLLAGAMSFAAYAIALWAMTVAPIGAVAAVRESSVLFATAIGAAMLGERFGPLRWVAALLVVAGLATIKLGGAG
jgi:drug/metabolite transporter (DMT)-like permease